MSLAYALFPSWAGSLAEETTLNLFGGHRCTLVCWFVFHIIFPGLTFSVLRPWGPEDTLTQTRAQAQRQLRPDKHASWSYLNLASHSHTYIYTKTNCPDGIWLCDLGSLVWGSLLLNPLNALGIPPSSSLYLSLLCLPTSRSCVMAEWTLVIWQIKSRPRWSLLYLWEPCLLPENALLFTDVS